MPILQEAGSKVDRLARGAPVSEGHESNLVTRRIAAVPTAMFTDECAFGEGAPEAAVRGEIQSQRGDMRTKSIIGRYRLAHQIRPLRANAGINVLTVIAIGPAIEGALANGCKIVGDQLRPELVPFIDDRPQLLGPGIDGQGSRVADAGGEDAVGTGLAVDFPDHRAVFLHIHTALTDIAVRAYADIQL